MIDDGALTSTTAGCRKLGARFAVVTVVVDVFVDVVVDIIACVIVNVVLANVSHPEADARLTMISPSGIGEKRDCFRRVRISLSLKALCGVAILLETRLSTSGCVVCTRIRCAAVMYPRKDATSGCSRGDAASD